MKRKVCLQLFGVMRSFGLGASMVLEVPDGTSLAQLRGYVTEQVRREGVLIEENALLECAIANDEAVLPEEFVVRHDLNLAILPPVCGG
ncbi:MAG: MoaD/ThiS family protein [Bdellovibrionales bacterium]|nr:MoaD/ThiS family protein [Bdellovibrionales bacterium]